MDVVQLLVRADADVNAGRRWTALHGAVNEGHRDIAELLISKGADVNAKTSLGQTPLQLAKPRRNTAAIEVLRKHGAKE